MDKIFHIVSNKEWGGGEQYVYDLGGRQQADGWDVTIVCKPIEGIGRKYEEAGMRVMALPLGGAVDLRSAWRLASVLNSAGRCVVHAHNFKDAFTACYARRLSRNKEIRVVMCRHLTRTGRNSLLYRWLYRQLDCLCFDSEVSRDRFLSTNPAIEFRKLRIVHTSVVVPPGLQPASVKQELGFPDDCVVGMFHGRLDPEKGLDTLLEAVGQLRNRNFRLVLVGRGSEEYTAHLQQKIGELGIADRVVLAGFLPSVLPYVAAADFGILASTVSEGCPLSPQEYMSQGHPVVATDNGGQREYIVDNFNGLLVEPGSADQLAKAIGRLVDDADLRQRLGRQAKADFDNHLNYDHFYSKIQKIYEDSL